MTAAATVTTCPHCRNSGYVRDGNVYRLCHHPHPWETAHLVAEAGIPPTLEGATIEGIRAERPVTSARIIARSVALDWANEVATGKPRKGLLILGSYGTGKSWLAAACVREYIERRHTAARYVEASELAADIRRAIDLETGASSVTEPLMRVSLLALDDVGAEQATSWNDQVLQDLLSRRERKRLPTIITSNYLIPAADLQRLGVSLSPDEARQVDGMVRQMGRTLEQRIGGRLYSRLCGSCRILVMMGADRRQERQP